MEYQFDIQIFHEQYADSITPCMSYREGPVDQWQKAARAKYRELLGHMPDPPAEMKIDVLWEKEHELGSITKIAFNAEPGMDVPAYICLPKNAEPPYAWMICLQGHSTGMHNSIGLDYNEKEPIEVAGDRDFALQAMKRGYAALCVEMRAFGQLREASAKAAEPFEQNCVMAAQRALMIGKTLHGERLYDVGRALELLKQRDDVDWNRVGVMGNSTGGDLSLCAAALYPQIALSMPSCGFQLYRYTHLAIKCCVCGFIPNLYNYFENYDIAGLVAPRPLIIVTATGDPLQPIERTKESFEKVKAIYTAAGAPEHCHLVVNEGGHRFYAEAGYAVVQQYFG